MSAVQALRALSTLALVAGIAGLALGAGWGWAALIASGVLWGVELLVVRASR
jgi:hypothetical protein